MNTPEYRGIAQFQNSSGEGVQLREYRRPIDQTTHHDERYRQIKDGAKQWYLADDGRKFEPDIYAHDGAIVCEATGERLWPLP